MKLNSTEGINHRMLWFIIYALICISAGQTIGQASIQTPSSTQPITVQIQQTDQGARLMIPAGQLSQLPGNLHNFFFFNTGKPVYIPSKLTFVQTRWIQNRTTFNTWFVHNFFKIKLNKEPYSNHLLLLVYSG